MSPSQRLINKELRTRRWTVKDLATVLMISPKTVYSAIYKLKHYGIPVQHEAVKRLRRRGEVGRDRRLYWIAEAA